MSSYLRPSSGVASRSSTVKGRSMSAGMVMAAMVPSFRCQPQRCQEAMTVWDCPVRPRLALVFGQSDGDVDDHVFLAADVTGFANLLEDLVCRHAVALRGALGVQQEAAVDAGVALDHRGPVGEREPPERGLEHVVGGGEHTRHVDPGADAELVERRREDFGRSVAGPGAERAERSVDLAGAALYR